MNLPTPNSRSLKRSGTNYHQQEANPAEDRIFGTFIDGRLAAVARCRLHKDGHEVDGVFTLEEFRGRGLARLVVQALIDACGHEVLYMHSTLPLISFYKTFGFVPIPEDHTAPDDQGTVPVLLRGNGRVQRLPDAEGGDPLNGVGDVQTPPDGLKNIIDLLGTK